MNCFKKILLFSFLQIIAHNVVSQKTSIICGKVKTAEDLNILLYEPIQDFYNNSKIPSLPAENYLISKDSFYLKSSKIKLPSFYDIFIYTKKGIFIGRSTFLVVPGDSVHINFDLSINEYKWINFSGSNSAGNNLFQKINYEPSNKFVPIFNLLKTLPKDSTYFILNLDAEIKKAVSPFKILLVKKLISKDYFIGITQTFSLMYFNEVLKKLSTAPSNLTLKIPVQLRERICNNIISRMTPEQQSLKPLYISLHYFVSYYAYLAAKKRNVEYVVGLNEKDIDIMVSDSIVKIDKLLGHLVDIEPKAMKEFVWGFYLYDIFKFAKRYFKKDVIEQYNFLFPNSIFKTYLTNGLIENTPRDSNYVLVRPIDIIDSIGTIKNIQELIGLSAKNSAAYIDLWATWCGPCITEFLYNSEIDTFLLINNIQRIYISLDNSNNRAGWLSSIKNYSLGGKHVLAGAELKKSLKALFKIRKDGSISIPRYCIINKEGQIIVSDALRPSDGTFLIAQLKEKLEIGM